MAWFTQSNHVTVALVLACFVLLLNLRSNGAVPPTNVAANANIIHGVPQAYFEQIEQAVPSNVPTARTPNPPSNRPPNPPPVLAPPVSAGSYGSKTKASALTPVIPATNPAHSSPRQSPPQTYTPGRYTTTPALYDIPCPGETEGNPVCACQVNCGDINNEKFKKSGREAEKAPCGRVKQLCDRVAGCDMTLIETNPQKTWSTLKRGASDAEMDMFDWEGREYTHDQVANMFSEEEKRARGVNEGADVGKLLERAGWDKQKPFGKSSNPLCNGASYGPGGATNFGDIASKKIAVVGLSMQTPVTLLNSMQSWELSGLNALAYERILLLNDPHPAEIALGYDYGYRILQPRDIPNVKMNPKRDNVVTIGAAFYYSLMAIESDYLIFLEKDFMADFTLGPEKFAQRIATAIEMLEKGAWIVRLRSRSQQGCDSFKDCGGVGADFKTTFSKNRRKNHWQFYCEDFEELMNAKELVAECVDEPKFRCHTSSESNWSLNAVIVKKDVMLKEKPRGGNGGFPHNSIADFGLSTWRKQDGMEVQMGDYDWYSMKVPICISVDGAFFHAEIDG